MSAYNASKLRKEPDEVFGTIGQQVQDLSLNDEDGQKAEDAGKEDPEEFRGNEKVVEVIESLCMNCQEDVGCCRPSSCDRPRAIKFALP